MLFRVYEISATINESLLEKGRGGRNFYFGLTNPIYTDLIAPVISDDNYNHMKDELQKLLHGNEWLLEFNDYSTPSIEITNVSLENLVRAEEASIAENSKLSLEDLKKKIAAKKFEKKPIIVETKQYYRDPDVSSFAQKRAEGVCECCGKAAPFARNNGRPYLETHHLVPLSKGGSDSIENVCAVCPNCHKQLHYGTDKTVLKEKISWV